MIKIDYQKIGSGIYNMMTEEDKALVAFGMINIKVIEMLEKLLKKG